MVNKIFILKLFLYSVAITLPIFYLLANFSPENIDPMLRAMMLNHVSKQFWSGDLYPRWLMDVNQGLGSPVFLFQPPLGSFMGITLQWLAPFDPYGYRRYLIVIAMCFFLGGLACYFWLREYFNQRQAQLGTWIYVTYPSCIGNIMHLPALCATVMIFPLMLLMAKKLSVQPFRYVPFYAVAQAMLILDHLPSTVIFSAIPFVNAIVLALPKERLKVFLCLVISVMIGAALAAVYWLPLYVNKIYILYNLYLDLKYDDYFPGIRSLMAREFHSYTLLIYVTMLPLLIYAYQVRGLKPLEKNKTSVIFWSCILIYVIVMSTPISRPIWDRFDFLHNLQFPSRFIAASVTAAVFLITNWLPKLPNISASVMVVAMCSLMTFESLANYRFSTVVPPDIARAFKYQLVPQPSHMTLWMRKAGIREPLNPPKRFLNIPSYKTIKGSAKIFDIYQTPRSFDFHTNVTTPQALVTLHRYYYPGWQVSKIVAYNSGLATNYSLVDIVKNYRYALTNINEISSDPMDVINGKPMKNPRDLLSNYYIEPITEMALLTQKHHYYPQWVLNFKGIVVTERNSLLAVELPRGEYDVEITQPWFPGEKIANSVSAIAFSIIVLWVGIMRFFFKKTIPIGAK